jgi:hypothetical protein
MATLRGESQLGDLYGLLTVPPEQLVTLLASAGISLPQALALPGVQVSTCEPWEQRVAPERVVLRPVWTGRSLQVLFHQGYLGSF